MEFQVMVNARAWANVLGVVQALRWAALKKYGKHSANCARGRLSAEVASSHCHKGRPQNNVKQELKKKSDARNLLRDTRELEKNLMCDYETKKVKHKQRKI
jgi:hypothetical protein